MRKIYFFLLALALPCLSFGQTIVNGDMELWRTSTAGAHGPVSVEAPNNWNTSDTLVIALGQNPLVALALGTSDADWRRQIFKETTIVHGGAASAKIMTRLEDTFHVPGVLTNAIPSVSISFSPPGITGIGIKGGSPVSVKPTSVSVWVQYYPGPSGVDSGTMTVQSLGHIAGKDSVIGTGFVTIGPSSSWVQITAPITYTIDTTAVDTFRVTFTSSKATTPRDSSTLYVDDMTMTSTANPDHTGVNNITAGGRVKVYPNPTSGILYIDALQTSGLNCKVYSMNGQLLASKDISGKDAMDISYLPDGLYFYGVYDANGSVIERGKIAVSK